MNPGSSCFGFLRTVFLRLHVESVRGDRSLPHITALSCMMSLRAKVGWWQGFQSRGHPERHLHAPGVDAALQGSRPDRNPQSFDQAAKPNCPACDTPHGRNTTTSRSRSSSKAVLRHPLLRAAQGQVELTALSPQVGLNQFGVFTHHPTNCSRLSLESRAWLPMRPGPAGWRGRVWKGSRRGSGRVRGPEARRLDGPTRSAGCLIE